MARSFLRSLEREFDLAEVTIPGRPSIQPCWLTSAPTTRYEPATFDQPPAEAVRQAPPKALPPTPSFTAAELEVAVAEARADAARDAAETVRAELEASLAARETEALEGLSNRLSDCQAKFDAALCERRARAHELILEVARAVALRAIARAPLADVERLLDDLVPHLAAEPRLELKLAPDLVPSGRATLLRIAAASGYRGEVVVEADTALVPGDARLAWRRGEAERNVEGVVERAVQIARKWLESGAADPAPECAQSNEGERET